MFGRRLHIFSLASIKIGIDLSWIIIAVLLSWSLAAGTFPYYLPHLSTGTYWLMGVFGMLGLFVCVVLHELGHALVAKHFQVPVAQITLFIFGGLAEIKKEPPTPRIEFLIAIAGPIVSVLLAIIMYALTVLGQQSGWPVAVSGITAYLAFINAALVLFNMVPAFPLDGGRILRAILWWWKDNLAWATNVATAFGSGFALVLIILGVLCLLSENFISGIWMIIIGLFLQSAATETRIQSNFVEGLREQKVSKFMTKDPISVPPGISLKTFIEQYVYQSFHHLYPVTDSRKLLGYISTKEVKSVSHEMWENTLVEQVMVPNTKFTTVTPETNASEALSIMNQTESPTLMVVEEGNLVGLITAHNLFKLISLKSELGD